MLIPPTATRRLKFEFSAVDCADAGIVTDVDMASAKQNMRINCNGLISNPPLILPHAYSLASPTSRTARYCREAV
jgi:hypothetical protein